MGLVGTNVAVGKGAGAFWAQAARPNAISNSQVVQNTVNRVRLNIGSMLSPIEFRVTTQFYQRNPFLIFIP
jgi:hypothetical protein